jgi:hypothetical protein
MTMTIEQTRVYMTVKAAPLLQTEQVCNFLEEMNQEEITKTAEEEQPLNTHLSELDKAYSWTVLMKDGICAALGLGGIISTAKYTYDHSSYAKPVFEPRYYSVDALASYDPYVECKDRPLLSKGELCERRTREEQRDKEFFVRCEEDGIKDANYETGKWFIISALASGCIAVSADLFVYKCTKHELITHYTSSINDGRHLRLQNRIRQIEDRLKQPENEQEKSQLHIAQDYLRQKFDKMDVEIKHKITLVAKYV